MRSRTVSLLTSDQSQDALIGGCAVTSHLHRRSLHSRHVGESIEDGDGDGNGDKEAADERPQVAPPRRRLLSHHLHRKQESSVVRTVTTHRKLNGAQIRSDGVGLNFIDLCEGSRSMQQQEGNRRPQRGERSEETRGKMTITT